jgi:[amino group carrier protein]-lysine/ornithine hydrolase
VITKSAAPGDEFAIEVLESLVRIPSPSGEEHEAAAYLMRVMRQCGLTARTDEAGNVVGETPGRPGPVVYLVGHMDTVPGSLPVRRKDGVLYGRGTVDAKGPLAAFVLAAARSLDFPGRIVVVGAVEEETVSSRGAVHLGRSMLAPDALIVGEPSGWGRVVLGYKGKLDFGYRVTRPATHSSNPLEKATEAAASFWTDVRKALGDDGDGHTSFGRPGATLLSFQGDTQRAGLEVCVRTPVGFDRDEFLSLLREKARGGTIRVLGSVDAVVSSRNDPVVRALNAGIRSVGGVPRAAVKSATSDMNTLARFWSVPTAVYGPGDSALDHSDEECIVLGEYLRAIDVLTEALRTLAGTRLQVRDSQQFLHGQARAPEARP